MSEHKTKRDILIIKKPGTLASLAEDTFTFGGFAAILWFNHAYLDGNGWLDALFVVLWIMMAMSMQSRRNTRVDNVDDAIKWLQEQR